MAVDLTAERHEAVASPDERPQGEVGLSHVADPCRRYPGEQVILYSQVELYRPVTGFRLEITIPEMLALEQAIPPAGYERLAPQIERVVNDTFLVWNFEETLPAGTTLEFAAEVVVQPAAHPLSIESDARLQVPRSGEDDRRRAEATATIEVAARSRYLRYLPAIYQDDELMGRFLMLFESFWAPIDRQIDNPDPYFDPQMAPSAFLPWLASWFTLVLDERLPEARRRELIKNAIALFRRRGTKRGLAAYLRIYTGGEVEIIEHRSKDLRLGPEARLGPGVALGRGNMPHTFTVNLKLPVMHDEDWDMQAQHRRIETLIAAEKPAHTAFTLHLEVGDLQEAAHPAGESE